MNLYNYKDFSMYKSNHFHSDHVTQQDGLLDGISTMNVNTTYVLDGVQNFRILQRLLLKKSCYKMLSNPMCVCVHKTWSKIKTCSKGFEQKKKKK